MTFNEMIEFRHDSIIASMKTALTYAEQHRGTSYAVMLDEKDGHPFVVDMSLADRLKSDGILLETFQLGKYEKPTEWPDAELDITLKSAAYEIRRNMGEYADFPEFNVGKINLDKTDEPTQEGNDQFVEKDFGSEWQEGYAQADEMDFGSEWQDGYEQADEIEYDGNWQNSYDEPTEIELSTDSDISVDSVSADDKDMSLDIIDLSSTKAIENTPPPIEEQQQSNISETSPDTNSIFYKVDDLGDEHTDDSFSQSVKQHEEIKRLEQELARANAKISSLQGVIDKTNAVINSDKQLLSDFRAAMKTYDRTVGGGEKEKIPDQPKKTSSSKQSRK